MAKRARRARLRPARRNRAAGTAPPGDTTSQDGQRVDLTAIATELRIIGRSFALIALRLGGSRGKTIVERAKQLQALGLPVGDVAALLGSTRASVGELLSRARRGRRKKRRG